MKRLISFCATLAAWLSLSQAVPALAAEKALIIGIDYALAEDERMRLSNPVRDARLIENSLRRASVTDVTLTVEPTMKELREAINQFAQTLSQNDVAVIYYAGHAVQYQGENYLIAGDGKTLVNVIDMLDKINAAAKATIFFIDACRNSPYSGLTGGRSLVLEDGGQVRSITDDALSPQGGLAQIGDLRGLSTVVFFSTEPGNVALDGAPGEGSPFAKVLAREIRKRQSLDDLLRRTAIGVNKITDGGQSPWRQGDIPFDVFLAGLKAMAIP